jgi:uncharacterized membrane protein (TIGR02234 family)
MADESRRTGFAPTVLAGLATAALTAIVSARPWFHLSLPRMMRVGVADDELRADMPLALALALVVLAAWGVVLVSRGRTRRVALGMALLGAIGIVACVVTAPFVLPDQLREGLLDADHEKADPTIAYLVACVASCLSAVTIVVGWRLAPRWPAMGSRYDAPGRGPARGAVPEDASDTELWKALDEGRDPTDPAGPSAQ